MAARCWRAYAATLLVSFCANRIDGINSTSTNVTLFPNLRRISGQGTFLRVNNVDVLDNFDGPSLCHIPNLFFYSRIQDGKHIAMNGLPQQAAAAVALAIEHLNAGDGSVVPDLNGLNQRCNVRFSTEFLDTALSPLQTVEQVIGVIDREVQQPCAFLGAGLSTSSMASATLTGLKGYPQLSWISVSSKLNDKEQFPLFARLPSPMKVRSHAYLRTVYHTLGARRLALVYSDDPPTLEAMNSIQEIARDSFPDLDVQPIPYAGHMTASIAKTVVESLKRTKCTYVHADVFPDEVKLLMREAILRGVAGTGKHLWLLKDFQRTLDGRIFQTEFTPGDPLFSALRGAIRIEPVIGAPGVARYDAFAKAWQEIGTSENDLAYLRSMLPAYPEDLAYQPILNPSTFRKVGPYIAAAYDATVLLGLAACGTTTKYFTGDELYASMFNTSFIGATGYVALDPETRARSIDGGMFRLLNVVANSLDNGNVSLSEVEVSFFNGTEWLSKKDIIFNDGSTAPPADLPPANENFHFLDGGMRACGFCMSGFVVASSVAMSLWALTFVKRARVIRAAQPLFLHLICLGTALMGFSILPLVFDDGFVSEDVASTACMTYPWLLALGWCIAFSALFSKTMRVNMLFHNPSFRRVTVTAADVMRPMGVLLTAPLEFRREELSIDEFGRQTESVGYCSSDKFWWFFTPLAGVNMLVLFVANQQAYVARKISTEFAESDYIARAVGLIGVVALLVVPVATIAGVNTNMHFFVSMSFISIVALSLLFYIFVPKIMFRPDRNVTEAIRDSMSLHKSSNEFKPQSTTRTLASDNNDEFDGELVLIHPKLVCAEEEQNQNLRKDNARLTEELSCLKASLVSPDDTADNERKGGD